MDKHYIILKIDGENYSFPLGDAIVAKLKDSKDVGFDIVKETIERHSLLNTPE